MSARIAICLYEEDMSVLNHPELMNCQSLQKIDMVQNPKARGALYIKETKENSPIWTEIVETFADLGGISTSTASSGAILFLLINDRVFACCFGSVVANINNEKIVKDFGLAAAYQRISSSNIKNIESYTLTNNPITNNRNASVSTTRDNFNMDTYLENITQLGGRFYDSSQSMIIKGKEFYSTPCPNNLDGIIDLCKSLIADYQISIASEDYKKLTAARKVKTKELVEFLNNNLCEYINKRSDRIFLVDYELSNDISSYTFSHRGSHFSEITAEDFYGVLHNHSVNTAYLKKKRITVFNEGGEELMEWPLFKCLFFATKITLGDYMLYKGIWYEIQERYLNDLRGFIRDYEIDSSVVGLPSWDGTQDEGTYNENAAIAINGQCWDKKLYVHSNYSYGIEFCDVLSNDYVIHIKKKASSALHSHLLLQAAVSAQLLHDSQDMRKWVKETSKKVFRRNLILNSKNELKNSELAYLIVLLSNSKKSLSESLPFFSLVSFNIMIKRIQQLNLRVSLCKV